MPFRSASTNLPRSSTDHPTFRQNQEQYFADILGRKWDCSVAGHTVCVPTLDGRHRRLSEEDVTFWVKALCDGNATTAQPPDSIMNYSFRSTSLSNRSGWSAMGAVSIPPSRSRSCGPCDSVESSGVPGVGFYSGRALKWIGMKSLGAIEDAVIIKRCGRHKSVLKRWQRRDCNIPWSEKQDELFVILSDALELSKECYSRSFNKAAFVLGKEIQWWLRGVSDIPSTKEAAAFIALVKICLLPLILSRISNSDPNAGDLAWDLNEALSRVPMHLFDSKTTSDAICIVARELTYSTSTFQHSWLGVDLRCIIGTTLQARPLTPEELRAVHDMAARRIEQNTSHESEFCRPWEVAIFAECASQDPSLKTLVLGPHGLESIIATLHSVETENPDWEKLSLLLRSLAFLSEHVWVTSVVESDLITLLLEIFRRNTPKRWFCIRFWAIDTIWNVISHRPSMLDVLFHEKAGRDLVFMMSAQSPGRSTPSLEDYRKEAYDRAKSLLKMMDARDVLSRHSHDTIVVLTSQLPPSESPLPCDQFDTPRQSLDTIVAESGNLKQHPQMSSSESPSALAHSQLDLKPDTYLALDLEFPWVTDDILRAMDAEDAGFL